MDNDNNDKYGDEPTQVRSIIKQLNEEKPSKVKSREVVIRADGTKVVRVTKKRKVMVTEDQKRRKGRKQFFLVLLCLFLICGLAVGAFFFRMASMTGDSYVQGQAEELKQVWGASSVRAVGSGVSGNSFHLDSLVLTFPDSSMIERVEMNGINADLSSSTFVGGRLSGDLLRVKRITIQLRETANRLSFPIRQGEDLWNFRRVECESFNLAFGEKGNSPVSLEDCSSYMYYPDNSMRDICVFCLKGGLLKLAGWKKIHINEAKFNISKVAIEDFALTGTTDNIVSNSLDTPITSLSIFGAIRDQGLLAGPYIFDSNNMPLTEFTAGKFQFFLNAKTRSVAKAKNNSKAFINLPFGKPAPTFLGDFRVKQLCITEIPGMIPLIEHIEPQKRKNYTPPTIQEALVVLDEVDGALALRIDAGQAVERDLIELKCDFRVDEANQLQGTMAFGLPAALTRAEYPDGLADPIFTEQEGVAWLNLQLGGPANRPQDDSAILEARAAEARKSRPERIPFESIDVDRLVDQMRDSKNDRRDVPNVTRPNEQEMDLDSRDRNNPFDSPAQQQQQNPMDFGGNDADNSLTPLSPF